MLKVVDGVYAVQGLIVGRVYVIVGADGLTVIDSSIPNALPKIEAELAKIGRKISDVKRHVITHAHPDHVGSTAALQRACNAVTYVHARDRDVVEGATIPRPPLSDLKGFWRLMANAPAGASEPATVGREIAEGDVLDEVMSGFTVVETPGHSRGHCSFYLPQHKLLITGDVLFHLMGITLPMPPFTVDMAENKRSIRKIAALDVEIACFGHGLPILGGAGAQLRQFAAKL